MRGTVAPAEKVLRQLGIVRPEDIDLEVIAWHLGAKVRYRPLNSCEARIVGCEDRAIITVDNRKLPERQRYSVGHELGHWHHHRGRCLICRSEEIGSYKISAVDPERVADSYASDLLMPWYLFKPTLRSFRKLNVAVLRQIKAAFSVSLTAAAFRIMESDQFPAMLVVHNQKGRRYFLGARAVPGRWFPKDELDQESHAFDMLFGKASEMAHPRKIGADAWFDRAEARKFEILEQSFALPGDEVAALLIFQDEEMLE
jgi:hypothetical protein